MGNPTAAERAKTAWWQCQSISADDHLRQTKICEDIIRLAIEDHAAEWKAIAQERLKHQEMCKQLATSCKGCQDRLQTIADVLPASPAEVETMLRHRCRVCRKWLDFQPSSDFHAVCGPCKRREDAMAYTTGS